jgi:hypothetical protein
LPGKDGWGVGVPGGWGCLVGARVLHCGRGEGGGRRQLRGEEDYRPGVPTRRGRLCGWGRLAGEIADPARTSTRSRSGQADRRSAFARARARSSLRRALRAAIRSPTGTSKRSWDFAR